MDGGFERLEGKVDCRVSSDDRVNQWCLSDFCGNVCLAYACVLTHVKFCEWECTSMVVKVSEPCVCLLTVYEGSNIVAIFRCNCFVK